MRAEDVDPLIDVCADALWGAVEPDQRPRQTRRIAHLLETDPGGAWVAEHDGRARRHRVALLREGFWGLSLFALAEEHRTGGTGRALLDAALTHGDGATRRDHPVLRAPRGDAALRPRRASTCGRRSR